MPSIISIIIKLVISTSFLLYSLYLSIFYLESPNQLLFTMGVSFLVAGLVLGVDGITELIDYYVQGKKR